LRNAASSTKAEAKFPASWMAQAGLQAGLFRASGLFDASSAQLNGQGQELERSSQACFAANARKRSVQKFLNQNAAPTPRIGRKLAGKCGTREARPPTKRQAIAIAEAPSAKEAKPEMPEGNLLNHKLGRMSSWFLWAPLSPCETIANQVCSRHHSFGCCFHERTLHSSGILAEVAMISGF
jgi:hypothetical protein